MKVVFVEDVPDVARAGDLKDVANGYARNFLLPRKLAVAATPPAGQIADAIWERVRGLAGGGAG